MYTAQWVWEPPSAFSFLFLEKQKTLLRVHPNFRILTSCMETFVDRELRMATTNVLLVDDEIPFVETMTKRLSKRGINIITALSGQEALGQLEVNSNIEIVVLDIKMPGMDGLQTLAEIRRNYPFVEVIILTGHATIASAIKGMRLGAFDYLTKPCELEELIKRIQQAVHHRR